MKRLASGGPFFLLVRKTQSHDISLSQSSDIIPATLLKSVLLLVEIKKARACRGLFFTLHTTNIKTFYRLTCHAHVT